VVMEATGVYWKAPWAILEDEFECVLVNARHVKQVPGRKTDVSDAAWLCQLAEAGLLKASFVPPKPMRQVRNLTRYRKTQIQERAREVNRLHKALEDAGIKLDPVAADVMGKSGRDMLDALVRGTTDPDILAELARRQMRKRSRRCARRCRADLTPTTRCGSARSSRTSTFSTNRSTGSRTRSRSRSALSRRRSSCCARSPASSAAAPKASSVRSAPT
jgi:transposase